MRFFSYSVITYWASELKIAYEKFFPVSTFKVVFRNFQTKIFVLERVNPLPFLPLPNVIWVGLKWPGQSE